MGVQMYPIKEDPARLETPASRKKKRAARESALRTTRAKAAQPGPATPAPAPPPAGGGPVGVASARPQKRPKKPAKPAPPGAKCAACPAPPLNARSLYCGECARRRRVKPKKYHFTDEQDEVIRTTWREHLNKKAVRVASLRLGYPEYIVRRRATLLALSKPRKKEPPWTKAEIEILDANAARGHEYVRKLLAEAGHRRTLTAVVIKRKRLGCVGRGHGAYSMSEAASLLGVDPKMVSRWRKSGLLTVRGRGTSRTEAQGGDELIVTDDAVRGFVLRNPHLIDLRKIPPENHLWFLDVVSGGQAGLSMREIGDGGGKVGGVMNGRVLPD